MPYSSDLTKKLKHAKDLYIKREYDKARIFLKKVYSENPFSPSVMYLLGLCYMRRDDYDTARQFLAKIIAANPGNTFELINSYVLLAFIYARKEKYEISENYLQEVLKRHYENAQVYSMLGYIYNQRRDFLQAQYYYNKSLALEPKNPNTHNSLGYSMLVSGRDIDKAFKHVEYALKKEMDNPYYLDSMGWYWFLKSRVRKALFFLKKAVTKHYHFGIKKHLDEVLKTQKEYQN